MTEKQCRGCDSLKFHTDYHDHVNCDSKEMYKMYKKGEISYAASMYDGKDCPCYKPWKGDK